MISEQRDAVVGEQFLGEIDTRVVAGERFREGRLEPGEQVRLVRDTSCPHHREMIRVEDGRFQPVGYLPRGLVRWLAPLCAAGEVRVEAAVAAECQSAPGGPRLTLSVFLSDRGRHLLDKGPVREKRQALHEVVRRAYENIQSYTQADLVLAVVEGLRPLSRRTLLPETRLLLALMPAIAREIGAAQALQAMCMVRALLSRVRIGPCLRHDNLTLFPLSWPEPQAPPYLLLSQALEQSQASLEEIGNKGHPPGLALTNWGQLPILVREGEILAGIPYDRVVGLSALVAGSSRFPLPVSCLEHGPRPHDAQPAPARLCALPTVRWKNLETLRQHRRQIQAAGVCPYDVPHSSMNGAKHCAWGSARGTSLHGDFPAARWLGEYRHHFPLPDGAAGMVAVLGRQIIGMDLFDTPQTLATLWEPLAHACFRDALDGIRRSAPRPAGDVAQFLERVASSARPRTPPLGLGDVLEIDGAGMVGTALIYADRICHLSAFSVSQ